MTLHSLNILLVDDHKVVRDGVRYMLEQQEKFDIKIDEAASGREAVEKYKTFKYNIVIMDINMPEMSGIEASQEIVKHDPEAHILALSMFEEAPYVKKMINAGALGYVLKNASNEELNNALTALSKGERYYSNAVAMKLIEPFHDELVSESDLGTSAEPAGELLSRRELQILKMIANEMTNEQISQKLFISKRTVDSHRQNILNKTRAKNTVGLIKYAIKNNLV